jgi:hypothetical protein
MFDYEMFRIDRKEWRKEGWIAACGVSVMAVLAAFTFLSWRG